MDNILPLMEKSFILKNKVNYTNLETHLVKGEIHTIINIQYDGFVKEDIIKIETEFSSNMRELGYDLKGFASNTLDPREGKIVLRHHMIFEFPINKRITRPSMKILLGLNND